MKQATYRERFEKLRHEMHELLVSHAAITKDMAKVLMDEGRLREAATVLDANAEIAEYFQAMFAAETNHVAQRVIGGRFRRSVTPLPDVWLKGKIYGIGLAAENRVGVHLQLEDGDKLRLNLTAADVKWLYEGVHLDHPSSPSENPSDSVVDPIVDSPANSACAANCGEG